MQIAEGIVVRTNYNTGPYVIKHISGPCTCTEYVASLDGSKKPSEPHYHLTVRDVDKTRKGDSWLNGYRLDGTNVWSKDQLIFKDEPGNQFDLFDDKWGMNNGSETDNSKRAGESRADGKPRPHGRRTGAGADRV